MALPSINQKVAGSDTYNERKILADDVNQIREAIQTGAKDIKPNNVQMVGNTITADNGSNWIRRINNTFQYHNGSAWVEPTTANLLTFTAGENIAARDVVYLKVSDGKIYKASTTNSDWIGVATAAITSGASGTIYPNGSLVGGFSSLTPGTWYGLNATAGTLTANENYIVGLAISATQIILVKPKGDMSTRDNALYKLQGEKAINDVSATNSGVLAGSSQALIDKFLDSNGQNNTVDTGNTTGNHVSTNLAYTCLGTGVDVIPQNSNAALASTGSANGDYQGYLIYVKTNCKLHGVTKSSSCTADTARLYDGTTNLIASATFVGNTATFSTPQTLNAGTNYQILAGSSSSFTFTYTSAAPYPYNNAFVNFTGGRSAPNTAHTSAFNITNINITDIPYIDSTIQSVATTIPTGMTKVFVTPLMYEALATGDSITADVSIDNGAHYTTGVPLNTWTPITSANGTQLIVKANLLTNDGTTTPKVLGWRVLLE